MEMKTKEVKKVGKSRQKRINLFVYLVQIAVQGAMSVQITSKLRAIINPLN